MPSDPSDAEVQARFEALVDDPLLLGLHGLEALLDDRDPRDLTDPRRRLPLLEEALLDVRVELLDADEPVVRDLELASDLPLDLVHAALQAAFGWEDRHLWRFSLACGAFDLRGDWFLCPFDVEEGEDVGTPACDVLLGEVVHDVGHVLHYTYDYGDLWELRLTVRSVQARDATLQGPRHARCVGGGGVAPAEDSREEPGLPGSAFDLHALDRAVVRTVARHGLEDLRPELVEVLRTLRGSQLGNHLVDLAVSVLAQDDLEPATRREALAPVRWLLGRAAEPGGVPLTDAGHLGGDDAAALASLLPTVSAREPEPDTRPLHAFRQALQRAGLVKVRHGRLLLTAAGRHALLDDRLLLAGLAERLLPDRDGLATTVGVLYALCFASDSLVDTEMVVAALADLGWRADGRHLEARDVQHVRARVWPLLAALSPDLPSYTAATTLGPVARAVVREALLRES